MISQSRFQGENGEASSAIVGAGPYDSALIGASGSPDSDLDGDRVDLGRRVARSLVDTSHRVGIRGFRHAPDHP